MNNTLQTKTSANRFGKALIAAAILTFLMVMAGYLVRFDGSPGACSDWPTCFGNWGVPADLAARLDMSHRILVVLSGLAVISLAVWSFKVRSTSRVIRLLLSLATVGILLGSLIGREMVLTCRLYGYRALI